MIFYQDRLETNIGKTQKTDTVFLPRNVFSKGLIGSAESARSGYAALLLMSTYCARLVGLSLGHA